MVASPLRNDCETEGILPEEQRGFRPARSTIDMLCSFARHLQELGRARRTPLYMCFIDLRKTYYSVDRELLRVVRASFGVPREMLTVIGCSTKACNLACARMTVSNLNGLTSPRDCIKDVYCRPFFSMYFSPLRYMPSSYTLQ